MRSSSADLEKHTVAILRCLITRLWCNGGAPARMVEVVTTSVHGSIGAVFFLVTAPSLWTKLGLKFVLNIFI